MHFHDNDRIARYAQMVDSQCDEYLETFSALFMSLDIGITTIRAKYSETGLLVPPRYSTELTAHIRF